MRMDKDCVFCSLIAENTTDFCYQDEHTVAFTPLDPLCEGHILIVPRLHVRGMGDIPPEELAIFAVTAQGIIRDLMDEFNILMANGVGAQQSVGHFHWHVIPRSEGDGIDLWPRRYPIAPEPVPMPAAGGDGGGERPEPRRWKYTMSDPLKGEGRVGLCGVPQYGERMGDYSGEGWVKLGMSGYEVRVWGRDEEEVGLQFRVSYGE